MYIGGATVVASGTKLVLLVEKYRLKAKVQESAETNRLKSGVWSNNQIVLSCQTTPLG